MPNTGGTEATISAKPLSWESGGHDGLPLIIGHRGASAIEPENSLAAFERARADGADGVELDVLQCATGDVIVFHDDDLARLGGQPTRIADLSLADVRAVRLRSGAAIPTLSQVFEVCGDTLLINVELKAAGASSGQIASLVNAVATLLERAGPVLSERILVSSFNPRAVRCWRRRMPAVRSGLLFEKDAPVPLRRAWTLPWVRPFSVNPESVLCTPEAVGRWHRRGYRVAVWTVDDPATLHRLTGLGVDAIITNDPARSRQVLRPSGSA